MSSTDELHDNQVIDAVTTYVYNRHSDLTQSNVVGFDTDELERVEVDSEGYLVFTVEDVRITEKDVEDGVTTYYVSATLLFHTEHGPAIEGSTDIYQCYRCGDNWCIEWYAE